MLKVVGRLENLRRAPGPQGTMKKIPRAGDFYVYMTENHGAYFPFPTSKSPNTVLAMTRTDLVPAAMKVNWDGALPPLKKNW